MIYSNYDDVVGQLREVGLVVDSLEVGRLVRCKVEGDRERRGWYSLHELRLDGGDYVLVGSFGVWRGAEQNSQRVELKRTPLSSEQKAALKARVAADRKAAEAVRRRSGERAAARSQAMWQRCSPEGDSAYLHRKGVAGHGVRYSPQGALVIPMLDVQGRIHGLQAIHAKTKNGRDKDYWPAGAVKQGHFFLLGPVPTSVLLVAEGYATAASLFEATGWPVAVAFDAGNLQPVAVALHARHKGVQILVCADDDYLTDGNPGVTKAASAALAVGGAWLAPTFTVDREGKKLTDFNDLHALEGLHVVREQVSARIRQLGWQSKAAARVAERAGQASKDSDALSLIEDPQVMANRYVLFIEAPDTAFDERLHIVIPRASLANIAAGRHVYRGFMESPSKRVVRLENLGFDPGGTDPDITCNLWSGWPTTPKAGSCETLLELLHYLCSAEKNSNDLYRWVLKWLAYPIQNPGAKMRTALVLHGPQGTGKNMFFETVMAIYGPYGRIVDQSAVEDKFNDWASRKLYLIADEVVARLELYHTKNKLKSLITGEWIRINPKNLSAYDERNHVNLVFLSNEAQPLVLERDDRRYTVIWTPPKLPKQFYETVRAELKAGGAAALHQHLLDLELGDFNEFTEPPMTGAKMELIELGLDSTERFWSEWIGKVLPLPLTACRTEDLFSAYRHWCTRQGVYKPAQLATFIGNCGKRPGAHKTRKRHYVNGFPTQSTVIWPPDVDTGADINSLTESIDAFAESVTAWRDQRPHLREVAP